MKIKIHNDHKGKWQSYHAYITECVGLNHVQLDGYGSTEQKAIDDLTKAIITFVNEVNKMVTDYQKADKENADYKGDNL